MSSVTSFKNKHFSDLLCLILPNLIVFNFPKSACPSFARYLSPTIDIISPSNKYTDQQQKTLNYIIQILLNNENNTHPSLITQDMAMMLVTVGGDVGMITWVYDNKHDKPSDFIYRYHFEILNTLKFSLEFPSIRHTEY